MQEARVLVMGNSNTTASAPYHGCTMGQVPLSGTKPDKGENFIDAPNPSPPQRKLTSPIPFHRGWARGKGRGIEREGGKVLHSCLEVRECPDPLKLIPQLPPDFIMEEELIPVMLNPLTTHHIVQFAMLIDNQGGIVSREIVIS